VGEKMFLVSIHKDLRIQKIILRPIEIIETTEDGKIVDVELVEKTTIVCDVCCSEIALTDYEVVCEECRKRYFSFLKIYNDLDEALGAEG